MNSKAGTGTTTIAPFVLTIGYALVIVWVGLQRSIEAVMFKPNAFYFCLVTAGLAIVGAFLLRGGKKWAGLVLALVAAVIALAFYLSCFITQPEKDATVRVAIAIIASMGELCVLATVLLPRRDAAV